MRGCDWQVTLAGRVVKLKASSTKRWHALPLTVEEALHSKANLVLEVLPHCSLHITYVGI